MNETLDLISNLDAFLGLLNIDSHSFVETSQMDREDSIRSIRAGSDFDQLEDVCQGHIVDETLIETLESNKLDHLLLLKIKNLVVAMAMCTEMKVSTGKRSREDSDVTVKYMSINILCARKYSGTGSHMISAVENLSMRRGISITSLSSVLGAIGFYEKMGYSPAPPGKICGLPDIEKRLVLDVRDEVKGLLGSSNSSGYSETFEKSNVTDILDALEMERSDIHLFTVKFNNEHQRLNDKLKYFQYENHFDRTDNITMSKCLRR